MRTGLRRGLICVLSLAPAAVFADNGSEIRWDNISGVITGPGVDNPIAGISSGAGPWVTTRGKARLDPSSGNALFDVEGLVLNGSNASGTPGAVAFVAGTFICNPGTPTQTVHDTATVPLSSAGDAIFVGSLGGALGTCSNPLFLIRAAPNGGAPTRWIGTGAVRRTGDNN